MTAGLRFLGIETSCDETAAAIVTSEGHVLSNVVATQIDAHQAFGGVLPELAAREHAAHIDVVVGQALHDAGLKLADLDGIAVTQGPGLLGALLVGVQYAATLSYATGLKLWPVDHLEAHIFAVELAELDAAAALRVLRPFIALLVSGGHTALYRVDSDGIELLGQTRDDAAGEAFDKAAKLMGLGYPGGVAIDRLAGQVPTAEVDRERFPLPMRTLSTLDFSFSGLKSAVARDVETHGIAEGPALAAMCASVQYAIVEVLARKSIKACLNEKVMDLVLGGGVAANAGLRARLQTLGQSRGVRVHIPARKYSTDNAAMIAYRGLQLAAAGVAPTSWSEIEPYTQAKGKRRGKIRG